MQTYTHMVIGGAVGAVCFLHEPVAQAAFILGAVIPDVPMIMLFGLDRIAGRSPLVEQSKGWIFAKNICQSFFLWAGFLIGGLLGSASLLALGLSGLVHILIDVLTHGDSKYNGNDGTYAWPLHLESIAGWDYRHGTGILWPPKIFEATVLCVGIVVIVTSWFL